MRRSFQVGVICLLCIAPCVLVAKESGLHKRRQTRVKQAHRVKQAVTKHCAQQPIRNQKTNGDEDRYSDLRGSFAKGLARDKEGAVQADAYSSMKRALDSGRPSDFDKIVMAPGGRRLANPEASFCYSLVCNDSWAPTMPPAPQFASEQTASEMVELYWSALLRDVPFNLFDRDPIALAAREELGSLKKLKAPSNNGKITEKTLLRGNSPGELEGPYISQFFYQKIPYGTTTLYPDQTVPAQGRQNDFMTKRQEWKYIMDGNTPKRQIEMERWQSILRTPRDLAEYVHQDMPGQAVRNAALLLLSYGPIAWDRNNPYIHRKTDGALITFGAADLLNLLQEATQEGMKAAWVQKWQVNRRLRPEEFGYQVERQLANGEERGIHPVLLDSQALERSKEVYGSYLLPIAYPEGAPTHPSYPAAHAVAMGAGITILKAFFDEDFELPNPVQPDITNTTLVPYDGTLTVGGELNKLAGNIALGRDHAGVHYRSDSEGGLRLGEKVAIELLNNHGFLASEDFDGFHLTTFSGKEEIVGKKEQRETVALGRKPGL